MRATGREPEHSRRINGVDVGKVEDKHVGVVPVRLVRRVVLVMSVQLQAPQTFCMMRP